MTIRFDASETEREINRKARRGLISMELDLETIDKLHVEAQRRGMTLAALLVRAAEEYTALGDEPAPVYDLGGIAE